MYGKYLFVLDKLIVQYLYEIIRADYMYSNPKYTYTLLNYMYSKIAKFKRPASCPILTGTFTNKEGLSYIPQKLVVGCLV